MCILYITGGRDDRDRDFGRDRDDRDRGGFRRDRDDRGPPPRDRDDFRGDRGGINIYCVLLENIRKYTLENFNYNNTWSCVLVVRNNLDASSMDIMVIIISCLSEC